MENRILKVNEKMTWEQYKESGLGEKTAANFGYGHLVESTHVRWDKYQPEVYICKADFYGLDYRAFLRYTLPGEGLTIFTAISYGSSSIDNNPFFEVISPMFIEWPTESGMTAEEYWKSVGQDYKSITIKTYQGFKRTQEARNWLAKHKFTVTTSIY